jgi:receptor expression-enhancing protein 5/6
MGEKAKVDPIFLVTGGAIFSVLVMYFIFGAGLLCNLVGFIYPTYASIQALETKGKDDDTQWLTYWVIFAFFGILEHFTDVILYWIPLYFSFKIGFLIWLMLPEQNGAAFLYQAIRSRVVAAKLPAAQEGGADSAQVYADAD